MDRRHSLLVRTLAVLLPRAADAPEVTGVCQRGFPGESPYLTISYQVVRLWDLPPDALLNGGLGLVPLAPLGALTEADFPAVIGRMEQRIRQEIMPDDAATEACEKAISLNAPRRSSLTTRIAAERDAGRASVGHASQLLFRRVRELGEFCVGG